ncbi:porin [Pleionea sediminis]|uniref:porin n=1 Tax=Pleionea sediminis TaxID=2569479 RepID=UPI001186C366|nr:porin [Pleionea sediminis]
MNFKKCLVATAVTIAGTSMIATSHANDITVTPYGKINVTYQQTDDGSLDGAELKSNASRFGLKGKAKLSDSVQAIYKLEWQVDTTDNADSDDNNLKARNQFVGLAGGFGEVIAGRHDTPLKKAQGKVDLFNDLEGDIKNVIEGDVRADNFLQYTSPKFAGGLKFKFATMTVKGLKEGNILGDHDDDVNTPDIVVDANEATDASSFSIEYSTDMLFVAIAQDSDVSGQDTKTNRVTTQLKLDNWTLGAIYNEHDNGTIDEEGYIFSVAYKTGDHTLKLQTGESDEKSIDKEMTSIGWDIKLGKKTKLFSFYTSSDDAAGNDYSWFGVGLEQKF